MTRMGFAERSTCGWIDKFLLCAFPVKRSGRIADHGFAGGHVLHYHGAQAYKGVLSDGALVADNSSSQIAVPPNMDASIHSTWRSHGRIFF